MNSTIKLSLSSMLFVSLIPMASAFMPPVQKSAEPGNTASPRTLQVPSTPSIQSTSPMQSAPRATSTQSMPRTTSTQSISSQQNALSAANTQSTPSAISTQNTSSSSQSVTSTQSTSSSQNTPNTTNTQSTSNSQSAPKATSTPSTSSSQNTQAISTKNTSTQQSAPKTTSTQSTSSSQSTLSARNTPQTTASAANAQSAPNTKNAKAATITAPLRMRIVEERPLKLGQPTNFVAYLYDKKGPVRPEQLSPSAHNHLRLTLIDPSLSEVISVYPNAKDNNGYYKFNMTFDKAGEYAVSAEVTDTKGNVYTPNGFFTVAGQPQLLSKSGHLAPGTIEAHQTIDGLNFSATTTSKFIRANQLVILDITAKHATGEFHKALEPHVDQYAHLVGISEDKNIVINVDPFNRKPQSATQLSGPDVRFKLLFPKAGFYRLWAQFQIDGKPVTVPYDVEVLA